MAVMLGITQTITWGIGYYGLSSFMLALGAELGWSRGEMSGALSLAMLLSGVAAAVLLVALSQVGTLVQFYAVWALLALVMATVLYEPAFVVITAWFERQRTRAMMIVTLMAGLASTIFFRVAAWLIDLLGWRSVLITLAAFLAMTTLAATLSGLVGAMQVVGRIILGVLGDRMPLLVNAAVVLGLQPIAFLALLLVPGIAGLVVFVSCSAHRAVR